ncbi:MAG: hypothetical protein M1840_006265 [Geoglossum simile]|nr:MAG: hypothetical protein M1840_006265 [Geoglossum simile]
MARTGVPSATPSTGPFRGAVGGEKLPAGRPAHKTPPQDLGQSRWPSSISKALKNECNIQHRAFALLTVDDDGKPRVYASPLLKRYEQRIFPTRLCEEIVAIVAGVYPEHGRQSGTSNCDAEHDVDDTSPALCDEGAMSRGISPFGRRGSILAKMNRREGHGLKRRRSSADFYSTSTAMERSPSDPGDDSDSGAHDDTNPNTKILYLANTEVVDQFFETRFKQLQQLVCKVVAKAWIKVIEPKKQTNFPYNKGNDKKPPWWPDDVKHKEPDHLMKPERLKLVMTLLRLRKVPIEKLEAATKEVSGNIPKDKQPLLAEIYKVAKMEERYVNGELSHDANTWVAASDSILMSPKQKVPTPPSDRDDVPNRGAQRKRGSGQSGGEEGQSTLVSPVGSMGLQGPQEAISIRSKSADSNNAEIPFSGLPRSTGSTRSIIASTGYPQYTQPAMEDPPHFMNSQSMNMPQGYPYMQRGSFGPSSPMLPMRRSHPFHSTPPPPPPSGMYDGWPPQMPNSLMGSQMFNAYGTGSNTPPTQPPGPSQYQLLPPLSGAALPPLHQQHQTTQDIVTDRAPQQYEQSIPHPQLRAQSLSHPHQPGHSMLDFQSFSNRGYTNMNGSEPPGGMVEDLKRERMGGN